MENGVKILKIKEILEKKSSSIHFIGIGGVSMSSLAKLLMSDGHIISGSDNSDTANTRELKSLGITVYPSQAAENIKDYDMIVYTAAIKKGNPELDAAIASGILTVERCVLLGEMMKQYKFPVNIAGTHGKTTTTSMTSHIFVKAGLEPTVSIGGDCPSVGGNLYIGSKELFICEACEYVESFLQFFPYISVILNIEMDHPDYFRDLEHIKSAFFRFAERASHMILYNGDDENCRILEEIKGKELITFGKNPDCDFNARNITVNEKGCYCYDLFKHDEFLARIENNVPGEYNLYNSLAASAIAVLFGAGAEAAADGLSDFGGAKRRFEYKGEFNGAKIYDDYAHHPTEIASLLRAAEKIEKERLFIVFQPHTYTRTKELFSDFVKALSGVENLIITKIFPAREKDIYGIHSEDLAGAIPGAKIINDFEEIEKHLRSELKKGDILITVGAGEAFKIGEALIE